MSRRLGAEGLDLEAGHRTRRGVVVNVIEKVYQSGRKAAEGFTESVCIVLDTVLPKGSDTAVPNA